MKALFKIELDRIDFAMWAVVILFFGISAALFSGDVQNTLIGSIGIILLMLIVSHSIQLIINVLESHPKLGELTGYITNGPEALVVIVGLLHNKLSFAMGVPLGSNFANPILMVIAGVITGMVFPLLTANISRTATILLTTMALAGSFFFVSENPMHLGIWVAVSILTTGFLYKIKGSEDVPEEAGEALHGLYLIPAILLLIAAGYFLDPVVSFAAANSHVPEGVISFCVLSVVTSWPEFRTTTSLLKLKRVKPALMNIFVSNITNLWLACIAAIVYLIFG